MSDEEIDHATAKHFYAVVPNGSQFKARVYVLEADGKKRDLYVSGPWVDAGVALAAARDWCATNDRDAQPEPARIPTIEERRAMTKQLKP